MSDLWKLLATELAHLIRDLHVGARCGSVIPAASGCQTSLAVGGWIVEEISSL